MIIIQQDFNKVPLCLEGTKENSPFAVSGPALVFVVVFFVEKQNNWSPGKWSGTNADLAVDLVEGQRKYVTKAKEIWNKGRGNMYQMKRTYMCHLKGKYVTNEKEICDKRNVQNTSCTSCVHHMIGRWKSPHNHHKTNFVSDNYTGLATIINSRLKNTIGDGGSTAL